MADFLYKISKPRDDLIFHPSDFWHTPDWESSTTRFKEGYVKDTVLYVGDFDEVNIHLFPRVRTVRVRSCDANHSTLKSFGISCHPNKSAYIFSPKSRQGEIEEFAPTIFTFSAHGFKKVRKGEYVSWEPQQAISFETIAISQAIVRWNIQVIYTGDLDQLITRLTQSKIYFDEQT